MSDAQHEHHGGIRTPKQLVLAVLAGFLVPIIVIILLVQYVASGSRTGAGSNATSPEATAARIAPVADQGYTLKDANAPKVLQSGEEVYKTTCAACHASGAAGAPKTGDAGAWSARIAQGYDTLLKHATEGLRAMPARGGNPDLDNVEVGRALVFMANQSGGKLKEPAAPANAAPAQAASGQASAPAASSPAAASTPAASAPAAAAPAASAPAASAASASAAPAKADGKKLYDSACVACHGAGVAGAPKFGDKAAWEPRIKQGNATLYEHAIKGFQGKAGMMPPKGGSTASEAEVKAAVDYMTAAAK